MITLGIDIETYSSVDLAASGVFKYVEAEDFKILLFAYAYDDKPVEIIDLTKEELPINVIKDLYADNVKKTAHNANFEITCLNKYLAKYGKLKPIQWECTMVKSAMCGLPLSLSQVAQVLGLEQQKMTAGKALIEEFCKPNIKPQRTLFDEDRWELFKTYCKQDVEVERAIRGKLAFYTIPESERLLYAVDYSINNNGVMVDTELALSASSLDADYTNQLLNEAKEISGLDNPNSATALKGWLLKQEISTSSINKASVADLKKETDNADVIRMLELRQELSKTSTTKYQTMIDCACKDNRVRGLVQFYATRTGRWAGRQVQVQNLPQNHLPDLDNARDIVKLQDAELMNICYAEPIPNILSQLIRTAFIAPEGKTFVVADFSAIEARVISWLAGEEWRLEVFRTHGKIYEASAAAMFGIPIESVTKGSDYRAKGKIAELALGYQGGVGALKAFGADKMGLADSELEDIVYRWRRRNEKIVALWAIVEKAVIKAINNKGVAQYYKNLLEFTANSNFLAIKLPSGRSLHYCKPLVKESRGKHVLSYEGLNQKTRKWERVEVYGGKLVENIIQAIARDCLADTMVRAYEADNKIVMHVHDELIVEEYDSNADKCLEELLNIMSIPPAWCSDMPLRGDGYITHYYKKD